VTWKNATRRIAPEIHQGKIAEASEAGGVPTDTQFPDPGFKVVTRT
jgi:hypothetical protein